MGVYYSGSDGWMYVEPGPESQNEDGDFEPEDKVAAVTNWSLQTSMTPIETTTLGDTDTVFTHGTRTTTGSATIFYYKQESRENKAGTLINSMMSKRKDPLNLDRRGEAKDKPVKVAFKLGLDDEGGTERYIYVRTFLTSVSMGMAVGDVMKVDVQFRVLGAPNQVRIDNSG